MSTIGYPVGEYNKICNNDRRLIYFKYKSNRTQTAISWIRNLFLWRVLSQPTYRPILESRPHGLGKTVMYAFCYWRFPRGKALHCARVESKS